MATGASNTGAQPNLLGEKSQKDGISTRLADSWCSEVGVEGKPGNIPFWVGPLGIVLLGVLFIVFVDVTSMGMPAWGTCFTVIFSTLMSYGLGALMATTAQNMAMPSAMVLQLLFGFLLPYSGEPNVVSDPF